VCFRARSSICANTNRWCWTLHFHRRSRLKFSTRWGSTTLSQLLPPRGRARGESVIHFCFFYRPFAWMVCKTITPMRVCVCLDEWLTNFAHTIAFYISAHEFPMGKVPTVRNKSKRDGRKNCSEPPITNIPQPPTYPTKFIFLPPIYFLALKLIFLISGCFDFNSKLNNIIIKKVLSD